MNKKKCTKCKKYKDVSLFGKKTSSKDGLQIYCSDCKNRNQRELYYKNWPKVREKLNAQARERYNKNPQDYIFRHIKYKYKITKEEYENILKKQNNKCLGCEKEFNDNNKPYIDHCHIRGQVRGLLCFHCNTALGHTRDDIKILTNLINYIKGAING